MAATIIGGGGVINVPISITTPITPSRLDFSSYHIALDATQAALAQAAMTAAAAGYTAQNLVSVVVGPHAALSIPTPVVGDFNVDNISWFSSLQTATLDPGAQVLIVAGINKEILQGHANDTEVLIGNQGADTINAAGGSGTIVAGNSANVINLNNTGVAGGSQTIYTGTGSDTVNMWGGAVTVSAEAGGTLQVDVLAGANSVTGNVSIQLSAGASVVTSGNDTISFGSGADTVVEVGTATVSSGVSGQVTVTAGSGANSVAAGSGSSTLLGGSGADTFSGGAGSSSMVGGTLSNVFSGATGHDTMVGNLSAGSNLFSFDSTQNGGTHTIDNFVGGAGELKLVGYTTSDVLSHSNVVGGNTVIGLTDGTTITLVGYTHLTATDISH